MQINMHGKINKHQIVDSFGLTLKTVLAVIKTRKERLFNYKNLYLS